MISVPVTLHKIDTNTITIQTMDGQLLTVEKGSDETFLQNKSVGDTLIFTLTHDQDILNTLLHT